MSQDTRSSTYWGIFALVVGCGMCLSFVVDMLCRHPVLVFTLAMGVVMLTGRHLPFTYTDKALQKHLPLAGTLRELIVPLLMLVGWAYAIYQFWIDRTGRALLLFVLLYIADRVVAWSVREHMWWLVRRRQARAMPDTKRPAEVIVPSEFIPPSA